MKGQARHILATIVFLLASSPGGGFLFAQNADDGKIVERTKYSFAAFERAESVGKLYSKQEYEEAINDSKFEMERLKYSKRRFSGHCLSLQTEGNQKQKISDDNF